MFPYLALIFLIIPVIEIYFLIQVGELIGALWTVFLVVLTAIIGVRLLKLQGLSTLMKAQEKMQSGTLPASEIMEGIALIIAGAFLLTPGFFTDFIGFLLLFPFSRKAIVSLFAVRAGGYFKQNMHTNFNQQGAHPFEQKKHSSNDDIIEGVKYCKEEND